MNYYIKKIQLLLRRKNIDAAIVYANAYDDRFMKAFSETYSVLQNYLVITHKDCFVSESSYLVNDLKRRTSLKIIEAQREVEIFTPVRESLKKGLKIGIIGSCKHRDIVQLKPKRVVDLNQTAEKIIIYKSDEYIYQLKIHAKKLKLIMSNIVIKPGMNQVNIVTKIKKRIAEVNYEQSFQIAISSGKDLFASTTFMPQDIKIQKKDAVCIDMGIKKSIYTTDRTRMYFTNHPKARKVYDKIRKRHIYLIKNIIKPQTTFSKLRREFSKDSSSYKEVSGFIDTFFGHGIGFGLHELPQLKKTSAKIGTNKVFTIEPTYITKYGKMRVENMVGILSSGEVINLTS